MRKENKKDLGRMSFDEARGKKKKKKKDEARTGESVANFRCGGGNGRRRADEGGGAGDGEEGSGH